MANIVLISGSLRAESANTAALRAAAYYITGAQTANGQGGTVVHAAIDDLPPYCEDVEEIGWPHPVQRLRDAVTAADALIIATPEYNGSMSGVLKNALDWVSRPYGDSPLQGKPAATLSASPSAYGAKWAHDRLRHVLESCQVRLINPEVVAIPHAFDALDAHGDVVEPEALASIRRLADQVLDGTRMHTAAA